MTDPQTTARPALITFSHHWQLDGDYIRCRSCKRPQIISCCHADFPHAAGCKDAAWESQPWKTLASLINAQIAKASP